MGILNSEVNFNIDANGKKNECIAKDKRKKTLIS